MASDDPRPEEVKCIAAPYGVPGAAGSMCNPNAPIAWMFCDLEHAQGEADRGGRLTPCPECMAMALHEESVIPKEKTDDE